MRIPAESLSPRRQRDTWGAYLQARLSAHPETKSLSETWAVRQKALRDAIDAERAAAERVAVARAALDYSDFVLDNTIRKVASAAKVDLGGKTDKPEYAQLFPQSPGEMVALPCAQELDAVHSLEKALAGAKWKTAKAVQPELTAARGAAEKAVAAMDDARREHREAGTALDGALDEWRRGYRGTYGALIEKFPGERTLVESFFYRGREEAGESEPARPEAPPLEPSKAK